jgi:hypothetical protein
LVTLVGHAATISAGKWIFGFMELSGDAPGEIQTG